MSDFPTTLRVIAAYKAGEDLAERLATAVSVQQSMSEALMKAADEIERLRKGAVESRETVRDGVVPTVTWFDQKVAEECRIAQAEAARLRLTDAERAAVEWCVEMATIHATECDDELAALRKLLERLT